MSISDAQCRAARAVLNWSQGALAEKAGVSRATLADFESGKRTPIANNLAAIEQALTNAGIQFVDDGDVAGGKGVVLRK